MRLFIIALIVFFASCRESGPTWEQTLAKQTSRPGSIKAIDSLVLKFMKAYLIPGLSIAVVRGSLPVFSKGYGFADRATKTEVTDSSLFRIGSLSCTVTALAIMKLIEQQKLSMESNVFGPNGILGKAGATKAYSPGIDHITIGQLLQHTCGGWSGNDDPVYMPVLRRTSVSRDTLIGIALDNIQLKNVPGNAYAFSGFGYFILGRVIEKITGENYAVWVQKNILGPLEIKNMQITADKVDEKKPNEVSCYNESRSFFTGDGDYKMDEPVFSGRADACSGWIASAADVARLVAAASADSCVLLHKDTQKIMFAGSVANPHAASGWLYNEDYKNRFWQSEEHGQTAEFVRAYNGYTWVLLVNADRPGYPDYMLDIDQFVWKILSNNNMQWPG